ncbi:MAG: hypothetical protein ACOY7T_15460 [Pseudomonadota bacterium]
MSYLLDERLLITRNANPAPVGLFHMDQLIDLFAAMLAGKNQHPCLATGALVIWQ